MKIRIIATPPGEAPLDIREQWIGLILDVDGSALTRTPSVGVLSSRSFGKQLRAIFRPDMIRGYRVQSAPALQALRLHAPAAAAWWEQHCPQLLKKGRRLVFHEDVC